MGNSIGSYEPPLSVPEFRFKANVKVSKRKSIFVADTGKESIEDVLEIAKDCAQKMGMGDKALLQTGDCLYSAKEKGWSVIVKSRL